MELRWRERERGREGRREGETDRERERESISGNHPLQTVGNFIFEEKLSQSRGVKAWFWRQSGGERRRGGGGSSGRLDSGCDKGPEQGGYRHKRSNQSFPTSAARRVNNGILFVFRRCRVSEDTCVFQQ